MKDFEAYPPLIVNSAKGSYLFTEGGPVIDAISSWWCKSLGHGHPRIIAAIKKQLDIFEHVIAANTTHPLLVQLAEKLSSITGKQRVFFASDGSSAVEIALKLAIHANQIKGQRHRNQFIALANSYHGETLATLNVSDLGIYKEPYQGLGPTCHFIDSIPYTSCCIAENEYWLKTHAWLETIKDNVCALIVEPLVQGSSGMRLYSTEFLYNLAGWAKANDIYLIADEIMTGIGRTGTWLACGHAKINPDLICLSKGLTSGTIPLSCVMIDESIYQLFYDDYNKGNSFLHSHTYSGNALAVAAALATLETIEVESVLEQTQQLSIDMYKQFKNVADECGKLCNLRWIGGIIAGDLPALDNQRVSQRIYQEALKRGALLRPLGNTLYWLPPLNTPEQTIVNLAEITLNSINAVYD